MYDVQIKKNGEWMWAGVEPVGTKFYHSTRCQMVKMAKDPYWTNVIGATAFRVRTVPGVDPKVPGPRQVAREALALAKAAEERCERLTGEHKVAVNTLAKALDKAVKERDEARKLAEDYASMQGLAIDWD